MSQEEFIYVSRTFTWKVEDFMGKVESFKISEFIRSPKFSVDDRPCETKDSRFMLRLYPKGGASSQDHIGLFLEKESEEEVNYVKIVLFMLDEHGQRVVVARAENGLMKDKAWGWNKFCTRSSVETNANKVMVAGCITFGCELKLRLPVNKVKLGPCLDEELFLGLKQNILTDLTLVCGGKRFECHKFLLASRSSVFRETFENSDKEDGGDINIDQMEPHVMEKLIEFIYTNRVDLSEHCQELFLAADRFNVLGLKSRAELKMVDSLSIDSVAQVLALFDTHGCEAKGAEEDAVKFALRNLAAVIETDAWQKVFELHPRLVKKIFEEMAAMQKSTS